MLWAVLQIGELLARAGGGGSSSGGSSGGSSSGGSSYSTSSSSSGGGSGSTGPWWVGLIVFAFFGLAVMVVIALASKATAKLAQSRRPKNSQPDLDRAMAADPAWAKLIEETKAIFMRFQADWQNYNFASMQSYLAKPYYEHVKLMLTAMRNMNRRNEMTNLKIHQAYPSQVNDLPGAVGDSVDVTFTASCTDKLIQEDKVLTVSNDAFTETWQFSRTKTGWQLTGIKQATENPDSLVVQLREFAAVRGLHFSPDWGRLLLPTRGQLFGRASFERSDINNHVIGMHKKVLFEIYTYVPATASGGYTVAQATLPKHYENIVVRRKKSFAGSLKGLRQQSMEWDEFNKRYEVFATDVEEVTSFELLHPAFMEKLFSLGFDVNIEAVDNVIYLYSSGAVDYAVMLDVLMEAFKELKL